MTMGSVSPELARCRRRDFLVLLLIRNAREGALEMGIVCSHLGMATCYRHATRSIRLVEQFVLVTLDTFLPTVLETLL